MENIINYTSIILIGYLIGSIPFALIVGKVFYNKDIRLEGSGNLGGTNAGRTLGKKAGIAVMSLDILKAFIAMSLAGLIADKFNMDVNINITGLAAVVGHCYPVFANFKGGKGVAATAGFVLALNPVLLLIAVIILLINLKIHHMVSLGVIVTLFAVTILSYTFTSFNEFQKILPLLSIFVIYQHRANIIRIINKEERKITWL